MATTKGKKHQISKAHTDEIIKEVDMLRFARHNYKKYGLAVLEDRAIPDFRDGMNPVNRRSLWSTYDMGIKSNTKLVKAARIVGDTMGRFHPHGDTSLYGAVVGMTNKNSPVRLIEGGGNWGSMTDPKYAAMRYTEMKLSKFSDQVLFNPFYTPVMLQEMVPNYDGSIKEPLLLPALLPIVLLNGKSGIAPGATTDVPTVTIPSLLKTLKGIYEGEEVTPKFLYKRMRFTSRSGGTEIMPEEDEDRKARLSIFKNSTGRAVLGSTSAYNEKTRTLTITKFADHWKIESLLERLIDLDAVQEARDDSTKTDQYAVVNVVLKKNIHPKLEKAVLAHIEKKLLTVRQNYVLNLTERSIDESGQSQAKMRPMSMVQLLTEWVAWRIELERKACTHWIKDADAKIKRLELLMLACDNLDIIFKALKQKVDREGLDKILAKALKITVEDAHVITEMRVYQLRSLEKNDLIKKRKEIQAERATLKERRSNPTAFMATQLDTFKFN